MACKTECVGKWHILVSSCSPGGAREHGKNQNTGQIHFQISSSQYFHKGFYVRASIYKGEYRFSI